MPIPSNTGIEEAFGEGSFEAREGRRLVQQKEEERKWPLKNRRPFFVPAPKFFSFFLFLLFSTGATLQRAPTSTTEQFT